MTIANHLCHFRFNGKAYELQMTTGLVQDANLRAETRISSSGGGTSTTTHHGPYSSSTTHSPVQISSTTTHYTQLFLIDRNGVEHALELVGYKDFMCRKDQVISLIYAVNEATGKGPLVGAYNHNTKKALYDYPAIRRLMKPSAWALIGAGVLGVLCLISDGFWALVIGGAIGAGIGAIASAITASSRLSAFRKSPEFAQFKDALEAVRPADHMPPVSQASA